MKNQNQKLDTNCPKCSSADTQSFQMAYQSGTSSGNISMGTYSEGDGFGLSGGRMTSQTMLAKRLTPPAKPSGVPAGILSLIIGVAIGWVVYVFLAFYSEMFSQLALVFLPLPIAIALYFAIAPPMLKKLNGKYNAEMQRWSNSWVCLRCGNAWRPRPLRSSEAVTA